MCGIIGYYLDGLSSHPLIEKGVENLKHRGPNDHGIWQRDNVSLGHTRLSILDLTPHGHQPMLTENERYALVFNGEIYNYKELRKDLESKGVKFNGNSDTEILLKTFEHYGLEKTLAKLRGMFAFAIYDNLSQDLFLARDRIGVKPLVYSTFDEQFIFGSEIESLFSMKGNLPRKIDHHAIDLYLSLGYIPSPLTAYKEIKKLRPGHALIVSNGKIKKEIKYWDADLKDETSLSYIEAKERLRDLVVESTALRMESDVPLGAFLSGGIDSSIVVAAMSKISDQRIDTFSISFRNKKFDESHFANQVAQHLGTKHHTIEIEPDALNVVPKLLEHFGEPFSDDSAIPTFYLSKYTRNHVTVALTGDGPDEVFAGYRRHQHAQRLEALKRLRLTRAWRAGRRASVSLENILRKFKQSEKNIHPYPHTKFDQSLYESDNAQLSTLILRTKGNEKQSIYNEEFLGEISANPSCWLDEIVAAAGNSKDLRKILYVDLHSFLSEDVLPKVDIASMMNSLECRSPFLDHNIVEFGFSLPSKWKINRGTSKYILKDTFKDWLPNRFMERNKMGFSVPIGDWLQTELRSEVEDLLIKSDILSPVIKKKYLARLVDEHMNQKIHHSKELWSYLVLAKWMKLSGAKW